MPELPEVETIRIALSDKLLKCKILKVSLKSNRIGKYLIFEINSGDKILIHLGMTGFFKIQKKYMVQKHDHLIFTFIDFF